jgi:uncharacterized Zn finger protein
MGRGKAHKTKWRLDKMTTKELEKRLMDLDRNLEVLQEELDEVTTPWESERLEALYEKFWLEYKIIKKKNWRF